MLGKEICFFCERSFCILFFKELHKVFYYMQLAVLIDVFSWIT